MKKLLIAVMLLVMAVATQAQTWVFQSFDSSVKDGWWDMANLYSNKGDAEAKWDVTDYTADKKEGTGCLKLDYALGSGDSWGGYLVRTSIKPFPNNLYWDLSTGTKLTFWYKVLVPTVMSVAGGMNMEVKLCDTQDGQENRVYRSVPVELTDVSGEWKKMTVDFTMGDDASVSWKYQAGPVEGRDMQWDKVNGMELTVFYAPPGGGTTTNTPSAKGTVLLDGFAIEGDNYTPPITNFDNTASSWSFDDMNWAGATGSGAVKLTDEATDKVEGAGSLKLDYTVNCSQDWGGYVNFSKNITKPTKFEERTGLILWVKNVKPHTSTNSKRLSMRFTITEANTGTDEAWVCKVPVDWSKATDWLRIQIPLKQKAAVKVGTENDFPSDGFCQPWWSESGDKVFNADAIKNLKIELSAEGNTGPYGGGTLGEKLTGTILFDIVQQSGYQVYDITKPSAPKNLSVIKGSFTNLVSWGDVDNEGTEKYDVYASASPITSLTAKGVEKVATGIARAVQLFEHSLKAPKTDKDVTWYYAVRAIDKNKNEGDVATVGPITNKAKGIPTVALKTINFKADGDLSEFSGVSPFQLKLSNGSGFLVAGDKCDGDADCSVEAAYVAMDNNYLYFGADVNDDVVIDDPKYYPDATWQADAMELFIGMYNKTEHSTTVAYQRGKTPDYHLRFNKQKLREDHWDVETDELLLPGPNYYWAEKFPSGYVIEAKIPLADLANRRDAGAVKLDTIYVKQGYKVMFDLGVFDADNLTVNREGRIFWTPTNGDHGYENATLCGFTWIGDTDVVTTDVQDEESIPAKYSLDQNYPNPFNPTTQIKYSIAKAGLVTLKVYDVLGRQVADLVNKNQEAGNYVVNFDASRLSSGVYFYRVESGSFNSVKKMMLVK